MWLEEDLQTQTLPPSAHMHMNASEHTCIYTDRYMQKHIEEYPYIHTKETIRGPDISVDALKNKKEN